MHYEYHIAIALLIAIPLISLSLCWLLVERARLFRAQAAALKHRAAWTQLQQVIAAGCWAAEEVVERDLQAGKSYTGEQKAAAKLDQAIDYIEQMHPQWTHLLASLPGGKRAKPGVAKRRLEGLITSHLGADSQLGYTRPAANASGNPVWEMDVPLSRTFGDPIATDSPADSALARYKSQMFSVTPEQKSSE